MIAHPAMIIALEHVNMKTMTVKHCMVMEVDGTRQTEHLKKTVNVKEIKKSFGLSREDAQIQNK